MATDIATLGIKIEAKDIRKAVKELDRLEDQSKQTEKATQKMGGAFKKMGGILAAVGAGLFLKKIVDETVAAEKAIAQLDAVLKSTGETAGWNSKQLQAMATEMQSVTTFADDAVMGMQSVLLTFTKVSGETFPRATRAIGDMATAMGMDLKSATIQVGKALNDPAVGLSMLTRVGITFSDVQKEMIKDFAAAGESAKAQAVILKELETQFGGSAAAARNTLGGALTGLNNAFGDLLEGDSLGGATSAIEELTTSLQDPNLKEGMGTLVAGVVTLVGWLGKGATALTEFTTQLGKGLAQATGEQAEFRDQLLKAEATVAGINQKITERDANQVREGGGWFKQLFFGKDGTLEAERDKALSVVEQLKGSASFFVPEAPTKKATDLAATPDGEVVLTADELAQIAFDKESARGMAEFEARAINNAMLAFQTAEFEAEKLEIAKEAAKEQERVEKLKQSSLLKAEQNFWSNSINLMNSGNKKAQQIGKVAAIAQAVIKGKTAAVSAWDAGMSTGGPFAPAVAAAYAAASVANTASMISAIGGGGGGGAPATVASTTGGQPGTGVLPPPPAGTDDNRSEVSVVVSGGLHSDEDVRTLIGRLSEVNGDMGGNVQFVTT